MQFVSIPAAVRLVSEQECEALRSRMQKAARRMGSSWLLHASNAVRRAPGRRVRP